MPDTFLMICLGLMVFGIACETRCFGLIPPPSLSEMIMQHYLSASRRGLTTAQAVDELRMREALVRVRNRASETIMRNPSTGRDAIRWAIEAEAETLTLHCRRKFQAWAHGLNDSDILTPEASRLSLAADIATAASAAKWITVDRSDTRASLTVRR